MSQKRARILFGITDLFFVGRVEAVLKALPDVEAIWARPWDSLLSLYRENRPGMVILDLEDRHLEPIQSAFQIRKEMDSDGFSGELIGFYSHVRLEVRREAEAAGVQRILPRSAFTKLLSEILGVGAGEA